MIRIQVLENDASDVPPNHELKVHFLEGLFDLKLEARGSRVQNRKTCHLT